MAALGQNQASPPPPPPPSIITEENARMADQDCNVPHNQDMVDAISNAEQLLMLDDNHDDPLLDDYINGLVMELSTNVVGNNRTGFPGTCQDENFCDDQNRMDSGNEMPSNSTFGNPVRIPVWPVPPSPYTCSCCETLRQYFHVNGSEVLKLHVHGRLGVISHAVLEKYNINDASQNHVYDMFDFCHESLSSVRQFIVGYCEDRIREGYTMLQDPLSYFYEALCTGLHANGTPNVDVPLQQRAQDEEMDEGDEEEEDEEEEEEGNGERVSKSNIAAQRERAAKMKLSDVAGYFHLPIHVAAKELNLCTSAIKGICRREGMSRWPYRKVKSIQSEIAKKQRGLDSYGPYERDRLLAEIQRLEERLAECYQPDAP